MMQTSSIKEKVPMNSDTRGWAHEGIWKEEIYLIKKLSLKVRIKKQASMNYLNNNL